MIDGIGRSAFLLCVIILFFVTDLLMARRFDRLRTADGSSHNWLYMGFALLLASLVFAQPIVWPALGLNTTAAWGLLVQVPGMALMLCALALNAWSRMHLGVWYAQRGEIQPDHQLITSGPYASIRHPIFASYIVLVIGLLLVNPSIVTAAIAVYAIWDFTRSARRDDVLLQAHFPAYTAYMQQTGRFWPRLSRQAPDKVTR